MDFFDDLDAFKSDVNQKRLHALDKLSQIRVSALIWGPNIFDESLTSQCRRKLKNELESLGHYACFSEELYDPSLKYSLVAQQLAQAEAFDIIFSIPSTIGAATEIHDFFRIPKISSKIIAFLDNDWHNGYSNKTLIEAESIATPRIQTYQKNMLPDFVVEKSVEQIRKLQELYYMLGRRF